MSQKEIKSKSADEIQKTIEKILDYNKRVQKAFAHASRIDKAKPEESITERVELRRQKSEEKEFNDFLPQIKEEQKNIDMSLFRDLFNYETPDQMLRTLHSLETVDNYNQTTSFIEDDFTGFRDKFKAMSESNEQK